MTWRQAKNGVFTNSNQRRFNSILTGGPAIIRLYKNDPTIGDRTGHVRNLFVCTPDNLPAEPSYELWEQLHDPEITKISARLPFPFGSQYIQLFAQLDKDEYVLIGYSAPIDLWLDAELEASIGFPEFPELREGCLRRKLEAYEKATGFLPQRRANTR